MIKKVVSSQKICWMNDVSGFECKICNNKVNNKSFLAREMMFGLGDEFVYFQCSSCNCLQIAEFPKNISKYYLPENYYSFKDIELKKFKGLKGDFNRLHTKLNVSYNGFGEKIIQSIFQNRNISFLKKLKPGFSSRILDVGCGNGDKFLYPLYESGFRNVAGCDPFIDSDITYENGLKIKKTELLGLKTEWDVICFNHSFEHIDNQAETLEMAYKLLPKGGYCIIRVPTSSSFAWEHYGVNWFELDAPRHYFIHSVESMKYLANNANFEMEDYYFDSTHHQFTISERYKRGRKMSERVNKSVPGKLFHVFKKFIYTLKTINLNAENRGSRVVFYLRKN